MCTYLVMPYVLFYPILSYHIISLHIYHTEHCIYFTQEVLNIWYGHSRQYKFLLWCGQLSLQTDRVKYDISYTKRQWQFSNTSLVWTHKTHPQSHTHAQRYDVAWTSRHLKSPTTFLFDQNNIDANNEENMEVTHFWSFVKGTHRWPVHCPHKSPEIQKVFSCVMTFTRWKHYR